MHSRHMLAIAALAIAAAIGWRFWQARPGQTLARRMVDGSPRVPESAGTAVGESGQAAAADEATAGRPTGTQPPPEEDDESSAPTPWAKVDLEALRRELPDNIYWTMSAPTKDSDLIRWREEERDRWNVEYGKVLSGTATADEVDAYYAYRYRLSSDYIQFATYLLADYGDDLSPRDVGLLKVAIELHMARLEEIPRKTAEAHARREAHDAARRAWLESQKAFEPEKND